MPTASNFQGSQAYVFFPTPATWEPWGCQEMYLWSFAAKHLLCFWFTGQSTIDSPNTLVYQLKRIKVWLQRNIFIFVQCPWFSFSYSLENTLSLISLISPFLDDRMVGWQLMNSSVLEVKKWCNLPIIHCNRTVIRWTGKLTVVSDSLENINLFTEQQFHLCPLPESPFPTTCMSMFHMCRGKSYSGILSSAVLV